MDRSSRVPRPERNQLKDQAYEYLKRAILDLRLPPGEPLREAQLSEEMGISKTPIREAFVRLQRDGLVEVQPYRGATVTGYGRKDLEEIYELRELLEVACVREASLHMRAEDLERLRQINVVSRRAYQAGDVQQVARLFDEFDDLIFAQMRNRRIRSLIDDLQAHLVRIGRLSVDIPGRVDASLEQHAAIEDAIARRDPDAAAETIRVHIRSVLADQLAAFDEASQSFEGAQR